MNRVLFAALAAAAFVAVVGGGLSLLALLPLLGLVWGALDVLWLAALPLAWVLAAGKARKPTPKEAAEYITDHKVRTEAYRSGLPRGED